MSHESLNKYVEYVDGLVWRLHEVEKELENERNYVKIKQKQVWALSAERDKYKESLEDIASSSDAEKASSKRQLIAWYEENLKTAKQSLEEEAK